ncbi:hypothetical protein DDE74_02740 [Streptomyces lydicus]|uniref:Uncharacterized protein n=1 Tax=Streptomyces lydicus TaxID=47763 RepID=A0A3Q9K286_9ACTN|nr:hypothetical protein DDE74_02740 [Streptomyces lydicus]
MIAALYGAAALLLQAALPQHSRDRLEKWRDRRRHREPARGGPAVLGLEQAALRFTSAQAEVNRR